GKTCFVQGLVRGLGATVRATSPTFVLVNQYSGRVPIHHVDAYRTDSMTELLDLGLLEMVGGEGVTVIEWADKLTPLLPPDAVHVHIAGVRSAIAEVGNFPPVGSVGFPEGAPVVMRDAWRERFVADSASKPETAERNFRRVAEILIEQGFVRHAGQWVWPAD